MNRKVQILDIVLVVLPIILAILGIAIIYSLVFSQEDNGLVLKQIVSAIIGLAVLLFISFIDYRSYKSIWWLFYLVAALLLLYVDLFGSVAGGAMRWIDFKYFQLQPSEIAKVAVIVSLASFLNPIYNLRI